MADFAEIDPKIWRVIAGPCSEFPTMNSMVYYFPRGHRDESTRLPPNVPPPPNYLIDIHTANHSILCKVKSVSYLVNKSTDEITAKLNLTPETSKISSNPLPVPEDNNNDKFLSYVKILESSEIPPFEGNRFGSSCYLPDALANSILPRIHKYPKKVILTDLMGKAWNFTHYYYNTGAYGQKHVIREGWREFASEKRLLAGDAIVFVKKDSKIFVGIRRAHKSKVDPNSVAQAIGLAFKGLPFQVEYTPGRGKGWCDFVVRSHIVDDSLSREWWINERVTMAVETGVSSEVTWVGGRIREIAMPKKNSCPFTSFLIRWDDLESNLMCFVSPWQLKSVTPVPSSSGTHY